jgi:hypothetical protein
LTSITSPLRETARLDVFTLFKPHVLAWLGSLTAIVGEWVNNVSAGAADRFAAADSCAFTLRALPIIALGVYYAQAVDADEVCTLLPECLGSRGPPGH